MQSLDANHIQGCQLCPIKNQLSENRTKLKKTNVGREIFKKQKVITRGWEPQYRLVTERFVTDDSSTENSNCDDVTSKPASVGLWSRKCHVLETPLGEAFNPDNL